MIHLFFEGRLKNRKLYESFSEEVVGELFPREFPKREIVIGILFKKVVDEGIYGQAICEDDDEYLIEIAKFVRDGGELRPTTALEIATTIAHELTHIRQYVRRELNAQLTRWKGQRVPYGPRGGLKMRYESAPWEQEAFYMEKELTNAFW